MRFEWNPTKAALNRRKHGISFEEAVSAFSDVLSITVIDSEHSPSEHRFVLLGRSHRHRLVVVVHTERGDTIRVITARVATRRERKIYEEGEND